MTEDGKTSRGQFRSVSMDELMQLAELPLWGNEVSRIHYGYPIRAVNLIKLLVEAKKIAERNPVIPEEDLQMIGPFLVANSPESHIGPYKTAIDFLVPEASKVVAAQDGVITEIQDFSDKWGDGPEFRDFLNYVTISHGIEFSQYAHLAKGSVSRLGLKVGDSVSRGQEIANVGMTGWTDRPHLHFIVFRLKKDLEVNPLGFVGLIPKFLGF